MKTELSSGKSLTSENTAENAHKIEEMKHQMAEMGITFNGLQYRYKGYHYDMLSDAMNYARLDRSRPSLSAEACDQSSDPKPEHPTEADQRLMVELGITFDSKHYRYGDYRYDHFADAINYARLKR
jgi:hypothetical protein